MADISIKEQKLAAARKKLRKYQKKKADKTLNTPKSRESSPSLELFNQRSETSSRSSSVTDFSDSSSNRVIHNEDNEIKSNDTSSLEFERESSQKHISSTIGYNHQENEESLHSSINSVPSESTTVKSVSDKPVNLISSELNMYNNTNNKETDAPLSIPVSSTNALETFETPENEGSVCSETTASVTTVINLKNSKSDQCNSEETSTLRSTSESLRQLSLQISGLVSDTESTDPSRQELTILELEKRNNELASHLEGEKQKSHEYASLVEELKKTVDSQNAQIQGLQKMSIADSSGSEINGLREQLQVHIQTIGILVAEKSELQTSLSHTRYALEQKNGEVTELQGRLDACRERIKDMESSSQEYKSQVSTLNEKIESDSKQLLNLQNNNLKMSKMCDEMRASVAELTERLAVRTEENKKLNNELAEVRRQYELALVHVEQLRDHSTEDLRKQFEELEASFSEIQHQLRLAKAALEQTENEKQQLESQYKSYASQLSNELDDLKDEMLKETKKSEELERKKCELEAELKAKENEPQLANYIHDLEAEKKKLMQEVSDLEAIKRQLEEKCSNLATDNGQLSNLLAEQSAKLEALEAAVDRNNTYQVDTTKLLESMQSDKIAASRALSQNKQLKEQLEELQNGFVMMSNKKLELTEKLEKELHIKKNLYKEISELGEELSSHKELLLTKQREIDSMRAKGISHLQEAESRRENEALVMNGGNDFNHHSDFVHSHGCNHENKIKPVAKIENNALRTDETNDSKTKTNENQGESNSGSETPEKTESGIANPQRDQNISEMQPQTLSGSEVSFRKAHEALEKRFLKCMRDLAAVSDEKQNLEHVVQKLQLETEIVGDYITIYQFQRGVMKQQVQDLKTELDLLRTEKQDTINKLSKLQKLIESLAEDNTLTKEGLLHGVSSIISSNNGSKDNEKGESNVEATGSVDPNQVVSGAEICNDVPTTKEKRPTKDETVKQIIELIGEMESSSQLDISTLSTVHPCSHCSGKLITI